MVFQTNGSRLDTKKARLAIVQIEKKLEKWQKKLQYLGENKELFDVKLQAISDALKISIKNTKNRSPIIITVFIDSYASITKIYEPKIRPDKGAVRDLIYQNALNIKNNRYTLVL